MEMDAKMCCFYIANLFFYGMDLLIYQDAGVIDSYKNNLSVAE